MKRFFLAVIAAGTLLCSACSNNNVAPYLSLAVTSYNDNISPENGMTTTVLKYSFDDKPVVMGSVPYTSQYPFAVYDEWENSIYYSAVDESGDNDQLWQYSLTDKKARKLTDSFFAINYIIPRKNDIVIAACEKGERTVTPFLFDKKSAALTKPDFGIDFDCRLCTYQPKSGRMVMAGYSHKEKDIFIEKYNTRIDQNIPDYPPPAYFYELSGDGPVLLLKLEQYAVKNLAVLNKNEFFYRGNGTSLGNTLGYPWTQFTFKTGDDQPAEHTLFNDEFPLEIYDDFVFASQNDVYLLGAGSDYGYNQGLYHYSIGDDSIELIYDSSEINGYVNNFVFLGGK